MKRVPFDYREKQRILYMEKTPPGMLVEYGDGYFSLGRIADALEFYQRANDPARLARVREWAREAGDALLLQQVSRAQRETPSPEEWHGLGEKAKALGKETFHGLAMSLASPAEKAGAVPAATDKATRPETGPVR